MVTPFRPGFSQVKGLFQRCRMGGRLFLDYLWSVSAVVGETRKNCPTRVVSENVHQLIIPMKYGARNKIVAKVTSIKSDQIMSLVKFDVTAPAQMASVLTTESLEELGLKIGDTVQLIIKAIHVLPVKD